MDFNPNIQYGIKNPVESNPLGYYLALIETAGYLHSDLIIRSSTRNNITGVQSGYFKTYELAMQCKHTYEQSHSIRNFAVSIYDYNNDTKTVKVPGISSYIFTDGNTYEGPKSISYANSIGITNVFESESHAKSVLDFYQDRKDDENAYIKPWDTIIYYPPPHILIEPSDNFHYNLYIVPTIDHKALHITSTGRLVVSDIKFAATFDTYQQALFHKLRYERQFK
jgi:hypothetical protein